MNYLQSFGVFFKIGFFTIGGGYAMIPLIEREIVEKRKWVSKEEFLDLLAVSQSAPGVFAVNISIFIGYKLSGIKGSLCTAIGTVLPSILCILIIALFFHQYKEITWVENVFRGIRPAVVALIAVPVFTVAKTAKLTWTTIWIPIVVALLIALFGVSPVYIILIAAISGYVWGRYKKREKK